MMLEPDEQKELIRSLNREWQSKFGLDHWRNAGPAARLAAAVEMKDEFYRRQGIDPETVTFDRTKTRILRPGDPRCEDDY
jgi:hypothetical protein